MVFYDRPFFLLAPSKITHYLTRVFNTWEIPVEYTGKSNTSNSWYIKLSLGTIQEPRSMHIRISDHDSTNADSVYTYDCLGSMQRDGSGGITPITYIKLLGILSQEWQLTLPPLCIYLSHYEKQHAIALQKNRKHSPFTRGSRLYVA